MNIIVASRYLEHSLIFDPCIPELREGVRVDTFPLGLKTMILRVLQDFRDATDIVVPSNPMHAVIQFSDQNYTLETMGDKRRQLFIETIELVRWFYQEHWLDDSLAHDGEAMCAHCRTIQEHDWNSESHCRTLNCPSVEKWRLILKS